jgi:hypothetical protein
VEVRVVASYLGGGYFTAINVRNPTGNQISSKKKFALAGQEEKKVMAQEKETADYVRLKVAVNLLELKDAEKVPWGVAYAFSSGGRLLAQEGLDEEGTASLTFPVAKEARSVRVVVGPEMEEASISELLRRGLRSAFCTLSRMISPHL